MSKSQHMKGFSNYCIRSWFEVREIPKCVFSQQMCERSLCISMCKIHRHITLDVFWHVLRRGLGVSSFSVAWVCPWFGLDVGVCLDICPWVCPLMWPWVCPLSSID